LNSLKLTVSDEWIGCILLAGLPEMYKPMIMGIESSGIKITADSIKTKILQDVKLEESDGEAGSSALIAKKDREKSWKKKSEKGGDARRCFNCGEVGHVQYNCPKKSDTEESDEEDYKHKKRVFCSGLATGAADRDEFYLDSGATAHMVNDKKFVKNFVAMKDSIYVANKDKLEVIGKGTAKLMVKYGDKKTEVEVKDVLVVPGLSTNLLSISCIADQGHSVIFEKSKCVVHDSKGKPFAVGKRVGGLYKIEIAKDRCLMAFGDSNGETGKANGCFAVTHDEVGENRESSRSKNAKMLCESKNQFDFGGWSRSRKYSDVLRKDLNKNFGCILAKKELVKSCEDQRRLKKHFKIDMVGAKKTHSFM
jgi:hypothetical protein